MFNGNVNYNNPQIPMASTVPVQGSPPPVYAQPPQAYPPAGMPQPYAPQPAYGADQTRFSPQMPMTSPAPAVEVGLFDKMKSYFNDVYRSDDNLRAYKVFQNEVDNNPMTLKPGSGDKTRVSDLQQKLNIAGFRANVNGIYGYATGEAVKEFKLKMGLNDGYLDANGKPAVSDIATPQMQSVLQSVVSRKLSGQPGPVNPLPVTQEDLLWAQNLMTRVQNFGYKPNQQEYDRYQDILARQQQNGAPAMPVPAQPAPPVYAPVQPAPPVYAPNPTAPVQGAVTQQELDWAMQMQDRIVQGYRPSPQEAAAYENIQQRYAAQQPAAPAAPQPSGQLRPVTQEELDWATQMQDRILKGYRPNQAEADRYTDIFNRYQSQPANPGTPAAPPKPEKPAYDPGVTAPVVVDNTVTEQELQWAMDLQKRIDTQGYRPTQHEIARYTDIYTRYQAQQTQQPAAPTAPAQPTAPSQPQQPAPAVPTQPQQPVAPVQQGATMDEIRWANQLEDKMAKGIQATADELYQYNQIQMKLANFGVASTAPATPAAPTGGSLTQSQIDWALQLQHRVQFEGYQPTQQEVAAYTQIFALYQQLLASQQAQSQAPMQPVQPIQPAQPVAPTAPTAPTAPVAPTAPSGARPVTQEEIQWATQLQQLVQGGYQASEQEIAIYTDIYNRMQGGATAPAAPTAPTAPAAPTAPQVGQPAPTAPGSVMVNIGAADPELQWALELLNRYRQGYQPTAPELTMYEQIIGRKAVPGATP